MSTAQEEKTRSFDCCDYAKHCTVKKIELFKERRLLSASIQMPQIISFDEYGQLTAYYRAQMQEVLPESAHLEVQVVPIYGGKTLAEVVAEPDILWQLLGVTNFHIFLKIEELSAEEAVLIRCSNKIAYRSRIDTKAFSNACEALLEQMCQRSVKVLTRYEEDDSLAEVPDDYFGPSQQWAQIRAEQSKAAPSKPAPKRSNNAPRPTSGVAAPPGVLKGKLITAGVVAISEI